MLNAYEGENRFTRGARQLSRSLGKPIVTATQSRDHDWQERGKCLSCKRPIYVMRRGTDFAMQRDEKCRCDVREVQHA